MKIISIKSLIASFCIGAVLPSYAQEESYNDTLALSLDQCITIALSENPTIKVADMEIERMDYSKKETLGQLLPSISFGAQYSRTIAKQVMYLNMGALGGGSASGSTEGATGTEGSESEAASRKASSVWHKNGA